METVVIVGTSSGLGFELRKILAETEVNIVTVNRKLTPEDSTSKYPSFPIVYDLQHGNFDISMVPERFLSEATGVVLVLNAATISPLGPTINHSGEEIERGFKTNFFGYVSIVQAFVEMASIFSFKLSVIVIGTGATSKIIPGWFVYSASKATLESYLEFVASENPEVSIVSFHPGIFQSKIQAEISNYGSAAMEYSQALPPPTEAASKLAKLILGMI